MNKSIGLVFVIFAAFNCWAGPSAIQMNDVSILFPLAAQQNDFAAYLKADDQGLGGPFVPKDIFTAFNVPGKTATGAGGPELDYSSLRMIALRFDPCFGNACLNQLRLIFQALTFSNGVTSTEDTGLHVFYSLTRQQLLDAVGEVAALRAANGGSGDLGPLAVHPIIKLQGVSGKMAAGILNIVKKYAGSANLIRMTRLYSVSDFWDFNGIDIANGVATPMIIPTIPADGTVVSFTEPLVNSIFNGSFDPATMSNDNFQILTSVPAGNAATPKERQAAFDAMLRVENPRFNSADTIDCASCHVSEVARVINSPIWGLTTAGNPFLFTPPNSIPQGDFALTTPVSPGSIKNFHAFSYRGTEARINQRVVNETAVVVDYLNGLR